MTTRPDPQLLRVNTPADLLAVVPYVLGFHPADSAVAIAFRNRSLAFAARIDLPAPSTPAGEVHDDMSRLAALIADQNLSVAVLIGYGPPQQVTPLIDAATHAFAQRAVALHDALRVTDGRYYSYLCTNPVCCPPEGTAFDVSSSAVAAQAVLAGYVALPDRAALAAQVAPVGGAGRRAMAEATDRAYLRLADLVPALADRVTAEAHDRDTRPTTETETVLRRAGETAVREAFDRHHDGGRLTDDEVAWLSLLLEYPPVRDYAWQRTDADPEHRQLWTDVTHRAAPGLVPAPASLLAFAAWRDGNGALAALALTRALDADPAYRMALLLAQILDHGVPPSTLDGMSPLANTDAAAPATPDAG